ncbi:uncharacterized protein BDCG_05040 [Blastomyces dermatitidis ER-3]|uniref:Uncharacterized protein n=1 Tax=Ajellomyces dermatitidis (strain ER-3 / ATCC MYA-2586) TaxID=559297 RepID=A0ABP2F016_AJEDR|nr:uncharacterized protein BDCG_05040 [Blastomyces dermatitidis ER-3]EEQ89920.2 hypothetical protein BDCG_05040 [Blastomyces dermatitidis ER-3]
MAGARGRDALPTPYSVVIYSVQRKQNNDRGVMRSPSGDDSIFNARVCFEGVLVIEVRTKAELTRFFHALFKASFVPMIALPTLLAYGRTCHRITKPRGASR